MNTSMKHGKNKAKHHPFGARVPGPGPEECFALFLSCFTDVVIDFIDMVNFYGPDFDDIDNRLLSLTLVKEGMTNSVIFTPDGLNHQPYDILYKKNILTLRGSFRPVTKVNIDMLENGLEKFKSDPKVKEDNIQLLFEITLSNLKSDGEINDQDFLDRTDILCSLGYTVMISNYKKYYKLIEYLFTLIDWVFTNYI